MVVVRGVTAGAQLLLRCAVSARHALAGVPALASVVLGSVALTAAAPTGETALVVGVLATLLVAWAVARSDHHRALARRPVPRHRDPDAPGHTRSRAPSELLPAA